MVFGDSEVMVDMVFSKPIQHNPHHRHVHIKDDSSDPHSQSTDSINEGEEEEEEPEFESDADEPLLMNPNSIFSVDPEPYISNQFYTFNSASHHLMVKCLVEI